MKLRVAESGRHFVTEQGAPFFWLADTAWNAALRDDTAAWKRYLETRQRQGFTAIQFVATPWRGRREPVHGPLFRESGGGVSFDEAAWEKMEEWISLIMEHEMVPAPVMIWDNNPDDPFFKFSEETCIAVGRRMLERWRKFNPVWILGGDGNYRSQPQVAKWKKIGRAVFDGYPDEIATMHPCGVSWVGDLFGEEPWCSFIGIQSGHGSSDHNLGFLLTGPYTDRWHAIRKPFINLEQNYEFATSYQDRSLTYGAFHVRRAAWWSILGAPTAGITYGSNPIWIWPLERFELAEGHGKFWGAGQWTCGLETEGIDHLGAMLDILNRLPWNDFLPADYLLNDQPGWHKFERFQKVAATADESTVVVYSPVDDKIVLHGSLLEKPYAASWADPRTGREVSGAIEKADGLLRVTAPTEPGEGDWVLILRC